MTDQLGEQKMWIGQLTFPLVSAKYALHCLYHASVTHTCRDDFVPPAPARDFQLVHRRIEWFMKFYIDSVSNIESDNRWRLYLAFRVIGPIKDSPLTILIEEQKMHQEEKVLEQQIKTLKESLGRDFNEEKFREDKLRMIKANRERDTETQTRSIPDDTLISEALFNGWLPIEIIGFISCYQVRLCLSVLSKLCGH